MDLDVFKDIKNNLNENQREETLSFLKELYDFIDGDKLKVERNMMQEYKIISKFRDEMMLERIDILNAYANETSEKGNMYFIYDKNSIDENKYNMCLCNENDIYKVIEINKNNLPEGTQLNSVLRGNGEQYILDKESTEELTIKINEMINKILEKQEQYLQEHRIDGHIYKVDEKEEDRLWIVDITQNSNEAIEEIDIPEEILKNVEEGRKLIYEEGKYNLLEQ